MRVALKFCGSCNPAVDLLWLEGEVRRRLSDRQHAVMRPGEAADLVLILCGCTRACADRAENRALAPASLCTGGESVEGRPVPAAELADRLMRLMETVDR